MTLYVTNYPETVTEDDLARLFIAFGSLESVVREKNGTVKVVFQELEDAIEAQENMNGFEVGGRYLIVKSDKERS